MTLEELERQSRRDEAEEHGWQTWCGRTVWLVVILEPADSTHSRYELVRRLTPTLSIRGQGGEAAAPNLKPDGHSFAMPPRPVWPYNMGRLHRDGLVSQGNVRHGAQKLPVHRVHVAQQTPRGRSTGLPIERQRCTRMPAIYLERVLGSCSYIWHYIAQTRSCQTKSCFVV